MFFEPKNRKKKLHAGARFEMARSRDLEIEKSNKLAGSCDRKMLIGIKCCSFLILFIFWPSRFFREIFVYQNDRLN